MRTAVAHEAEALGYRTFAYGRGDTSLDVQSEREQTGSEACVGALKGKSAVRQRVWR
jgi:hypothetical protein